RDDRRLPRRASRREPPPLERVRPAPPLGRRVPGALGPRRLGAAAQLAPRLRLLAAPPRRRRPPARRSPPRARQPAALARLRPAAPVGGLPRRALGPRRLGLAARLPALLRVLAARPRRARPRAGADRARVAQPAPLAGFGRPAPLGRRP